MRKRQPSVAIVGAGLSGIALAHTLLERDIPFVMFEKASEVGGTWRDNVYPGICLDTAAATYCFPFAEKYDWSLVHPPGGEVQDYLREVARDLRLNERIRFNSEVTECRWEGGQWELTTKDGVSATADMLVMATGFLRVPSIPAFTGRGDFRGPQFHSAEWNTGFDPNGKRVGVIGMGSSGIQITGALSQMDCQVTQFIRTPQWIHTRENHQQSRLERSLFKMLPALGRRIQNAREEKIRRSDPKLLKNGEWRRFPGPGREAAFQAFREDLEAHLKDPVLRAKMTPPDLPGCRRIPLSPGYYEAIQRPNVTIVRGGIDHIVENGLYDSHGDFHGLDAIVYATGFDAHAYFKPTKIFGVSGRELGERWTSGGPEIYRSLMVPDYPNLFVMHGPFAAINNIPIPLTTAEMVGYVTKVADYIAEHGRALAPTVEAAKAYVHWIQSSMDGTIWATDCHSWYKTADGEAILWPFGRQEHTAMLGELERADFADFPSALSEAVRSR
ncbi:putative monooxygenase [Acrocarpospora pleiomorpha]|uniref:Putative monooxygenase n=2 Tax=Acrocarpospora pleiomorpha TaxID=90975 RepID=A0A5M3XTR5_9ACTN|nr:NAD(P)/FAD-dependent oxidoreductase [Acrocarpospora pleiomorpha]GES24637.1 putative monooxygenase [Acrocarpospora pleiomorpha]